MGLNSSREVRANKLVLLLLGHKSVDGGQLGPLFRFQLGFQELGQKRVGIRVTGTRSVKVICWLGWVIVDGETRPGRRVARGVWWQMVRDGAVDEAEWPAKFHFYFEDGFW